MGRRVWQLINGECGPAERPLRSRLKLFVLFPVAFRFAEFSTRSTPLLCSFSFSPTLSFSLSLGFSVSLTRAVFLWFCASQLGSTFEFNSVE